MVTILQDHERKSLQRYMKAARARGRKKHIEAYDKLVGVRIESWLGQRLLKWSKVERAFVTLLNHVDRRGRKPEDRQRAKQLKQLLEDSFGV